MQIVNTETDLRQAITILKEAGQRIAFVPTMGNLHSGHLALVHAARAWADVVVVSIYVNPLQFGAGEDLEAYPRTPDEDESALRSAGVSILFMPDTKVMYPRGEAAQTRVMVPGISDDLCGVFRPGHFDGVATVVNRLLNLVTPDVAIFGKKDYQQLQVIRMMVADLAMNVEILGVDTVREDDGLAMSSRNQYLTASERQQAGQMYQALLAVQSALSSGRTLADAEAQGVAVLEQAGFRVDYVAVRRQADLSVPAGMEEALVVLAAARLGKARLIDNLELT